VPLGSYQPAAICRRGHVQTSDIQFGGYGERCTRCGAEVILKCDACGTRIRGDYYVPGAIGGSGYKPPDFCDHCGAAHPWVSRQGRIYELQNRLDNEELDPADQLMAREQLEALLSSDLDDDEQRRRWSRVKKLAPQLWESSQPLINTLVSAAIQGKL
jgi:hypothetical protein